ncbi:MAG: CatB-related O-acetyltransferase [Desulfovibrio sp.]|jgi:chloramphenicol O-acetyltransferase type B
MAHQFKTFTDVQRLDTDLDVQAHAAIVLAQGRHCFYSGYHHGEPFQDRVRYAAPDLDSWQGTPVDRLHLGNFCQFASGMSILLGGNHGHDLTRLTPYSFNFFEQAEPTWKPVGDTMISHGVWVGYEALILPGVHIGHGAVIGARAVVSKDVPPYAVVVGANRVSGYRFDAEAREIMDKISWWLWDDQTIAEALPLLQGRDIQALARFAGV